MNKLLLSLLLLTSCAAAPATSTKPASTTPTTQGSSQRADQPAPKVSTRPAIVARFNEMHEKFVAQAQKGDIDLLFIGDSITEGWATNGKDVWAERYAKFKPANFGISGDRTQHVLWRVSNGELENIRPKVAVLMIGTNNIPLSGQSDPPEQIAAGVQKIVDKVRRETHAKVLLLGIFPRGQTKNAPARPVVKEVNKLLAKLDDGRNVRYLDLTDKFMGPDETISKEIMPDFLHLTPKGYELWADGMEPLLGEMLKTPALGSPTTQSATQPAPKFDPITGAPDPKFLDRHEKFLEQARSGNIDLLFLGDSITQGWGNNKEIWDKFYAPRNAANFGIGGDRTQHVLWRINNGELHSIKPKVVVLLIGTNNIKWNSPRGVAAGVTEIVNTVRKKTGAKVLLLGVFPRGRDDREPLRPRIVELNRLIRPLDNGETVRYIDFGHKFFTNDGVSIPKSLMPDALHLSPAGYQIWADAMEPTLKEMLGEKPAAK